MDGDCVCPPRQVAPSCETCTAGWSGAACAQFGDDFERADGPLGAAYQAGATNGLIDDALIAGGRACGDNQAIGLVAEVIDSANVMARMVFDPGATEGQEVSFILTESPDLTTFEGVFIAGCDGGGGMCTLRIAELNQAPLAEMVVAAPLTPGAGHVLELGVDGSNNISLRLSPGDGNPMVSLDAELPLGYRVGRIGFIVGREIDGAASCVDDFTVSVN